MKGPRCDSSPRYVILHMTLRLFHFIYPRKCHFRPDLLIAHYQSLYSHTSIHAVSWTVGLL